MSTSKVDIQEWFEQGVKDGFSHMLVVCDTFDYEDYPLFVSPSQNAEEVFHLTNGQNMRKVMEVYDLRKPMQPQLNQLRVFNF